MPFAKSQLKNDLLQSIVSSAYRNSETGRGNEVGVLLLNWRSDADVFKSLTIDKDLMGEWGLPHGEQDEYDAVAIEIRDDLLVDRVHLKKFALTSSQPSTTINVTVKRCSGLFVLVRPRSNPEEGEGVITRRLYQKEGDARYYYLVDAGTAVRFENQESLNYAVAFHSSPRRNPRKDFFLTMKDVDATYGPPNVYAFPDIKALATLHVGSAWVAQYGRGDVSMAGAAATRYRAFAVVSEGGRTVLKEYLPFLASTYEELRNPQSYPGGAAWIRHWLIDVLPRSTAASPNHRIFRPYPFNPAEPGEWNRPGVPAGMGSEHDPFLYN